MNTLGIALAALVLCGGCSVAYRPGDKEFSAQLERFATGFEEYKQREMTSARVREDIRVEQRLLRQSVVDLSKDVRALVTVLANGRVVLQNQTLVPPPAPSVVLVPPGAVVQSLPAPTPIHPRDVTQPE